jgi:peptidoglycan/LPS O-acetylase OafA/YrhL
MHLPIQQSAQPFDKIRTYRPFIDGLRAIAILTVVGFPASAAAMSGSTSSL